VQRGYSACSSQFQVQQDPDRPKTGLPAEELAAIPIFAAMQENLEQLFTRSRRIIARNVVIPCRLSVPT
jgi:hypothetical protein